MPRSAADFELVVAPLDAAQHEACLSRTERQRAERLRFERDRRRFVAARARLRELLAQRLGVAPHAVEFEYGANGKPALARRFAASGLRFNVAHCDDVALYAFSRDTDIGVDIEALRPVAEADAIAADFFSPREHEAYRALDPHERPLGFLNCWTRKEALVKALGGGLCLPLAAFDVSLAPGEPARILRIGNRRGEDCGWQLQSFSPLPGFIAALARARA